MELKETATARIATSRAERLGKQFISHWGRHTDNIGRDGNRTVMRLPAVEDWPSNTVLVETETDALTVTVWAEHADSLEAECDSIAEHLHRFAGAKKTLQIHWK